MWSADMDVGEWLRGLGLGQYEATFRAHEIDADVVADLSEADLEKIGLPLGARKRLLKAIANLAPNEALPAPRAPAPPLQQSARPAALREDFAERRPITVMFCDLVGSTGIAAKLDAEDWRNLVNAYLDEASKAVTGLGGHVLKRLGDGLMALFGYPQAQENDAERAVRAALAIQRALTEINGRNASKGLPELSGRIGIESGPVVVEAHGEVFGDAPNVAARVQAAAEPGSVLVTMNVQRQVAGLFVAEEQGGRELKGVTEPVQLFRIVRASGGGRRGGARVRTAFVGREEELGLLARRWERARTGDGQLALVVGEPGLGKSRLIEEFHARLAETPHTWTEWSASQLLPNTRFELFRLDAFLAGTAGISTISRRRPKPDSIRNDHLDPTSLKGARIFFADTVVGDEGMDDIKRPKPRKRRPVDLRRISDEIDVGRGSDHRLLELEVGETG
jgi:class 3 adenylate cyclase